MINVLFCLIIVVVAIGIGIKEQQFIQEYQTKECNIIEQAIAILKLYKEEKSDRNIIDSRSKARNHQMAFSTFARRIYFTIFF